jgi:hypothetical protein
MFGDQLVVSLLIARIAGDVMGGAQVREYVQTCVRSSAPSDVAMSVSPVIVFQEVVRWIFTRPFVSRLNSADEWKVRDFCQ